MKGKVSLAILVVVILILSALIGYYLQFGPSPSQPSGNPSLVYDFNSTISGGSFLGWNASGIVATNETDDAITIHPGGSLSRQFKALGSKVSVSYDYTGYFGMTMVVSRQLEGHKSDLTYINTPTQGDYTKSVNYTTTFDVDNATTFRLEFEASTDEPSAFLSRVKLWNAAELP